MRSSRLVARPLLCLAPVLALAACSGGSDGADASGSAVDKGAEAMAADAGVDGGGANVGLQEGALRVSANPASPSAAYLTITGADRAMTITGVDSMNAERVEMHETRRENGMTSMAPLQSIEIPAGGRVEMRPGGIHLMVFGLDEGAREAGVALLRLRFADGNVASVAVSAANMAALDGGSAAAAGDHAGDHSGH